MQQFPFLGISSRVCLFAVSTLLFSINFLVNPIHAQNSSTPYYKVAFENQLNEDEKGQGFYQFKSLSKNVFQVDYFFETSSASNPYSVSYSYNINKKEDNTLEVDLKSALEPDHLRIDEQTELRFDGDKLVFPADLNIGQSLEEANGIFSLYKKEGKFLLSMELKIFNRKVVSKETISIDGNSVEAFVISYDYIMTKHNSFDLPIQKAEHKVHEYFIPGLGVVSQNREGQTVWNGSNPEIGASTSFINSSAEIKQIQNN